MKGTYISQDFDFLGALRERLTGLTGFKTLAFELIQNAEDAKDEKGNGADKISFHFNDESLIVKNNCGFREKDFQNLRRIASADKRFEEGTIGSFGIGFISVYQITDHPELITTGKHWIFKPENETHERIYEEIVDSKPNRTEFIFPWALDKTTIREALEIEPIKKNEINNYIETLKNVLPQTIIFLRNIKTIEIYVNEKLSYVVSRTESENKSLVNVSINGSEEHKWYIFQKSFEKPHDTNKKNVVSIALSKIIEDRKGYLYAYLPTQVKTDLPLHINADFYPTPDRKSIILDGNDYRHRWNQIAIKCAAELLKESLINIRDNLSYITLFNIFQGAKESEHHDAYRCLWSALKPEAKELPIVLNSMGNWLTPKETYLLQDKKEEDYLKTLQHINNFTHPNLRQYFSILTELGIKLFNVSNLLESLESLNLYDNISIEEQKIPFNNINTIKDIYQEFDILIRRNIDSQTIRSILGNVFELPIGISNKKDFVKLKNLRSASPKSIDIFGSISNDLDFADDLKLQNNFLVEKIVELSITDIISIFEKLTKDDFLQFYSDNILESDKIYSFFADNKDEFNNNQELINRFKKIPMFLAKDEFRPLKDLSLPGPFTDPLNLDILIKEKLSGKVLDLLRELGINELDLATYCIAHLHRELDKTEIQISQKRELIKVLSHNFSTLKDNHVAVRSLRTCKLIECKDAQFRVGSDVYLNDTKLEEIFPNEVFYVANISCPLSESTKDLYLALGVSINPTPKDIIASIKKVTLNSPTEESKQIIEKIFYYLVDNWNIYNDKSEFRILSSLKWLPIEGEFDSWFKPMELFLRTRAYLFFSQAKFIEFKKIISSSDFTNFIGLEIEPNIQQVIDHLIYCSKYEKDVHREVYRYLNDKYDEAEINQLIGSKCINIGNGNYIEPSKIYWAENPFPHYRYKLDESLRGMTNILQKLGVKDKPDDSDFVSVILEISKEYGGTNSELNQMALDILNNSYIYIQESFEKGKTPPFDKLLEMKVIPQNENILYKPKSLFFEDKASITEKFDGRLSGCVIPKDLRKYKIYETLGVKNLSNAIDANIISNNSGEYDAITTKTIQFQENAFRRIIESRRKKMPDGWDLDFLKRLKVIKIDELLVEYTLSIPDISNRTIKSQPISESVFYKKDSFELFVKKGQGAINRQIARELAHAINPSEDISDLGPIIYEIIMAGSADEAEKILDEYHIDKIIESEIIDIDEGDTITGFGSDALDLPGETHYPTNTGSTDVEKNGKNTNVIKVTKTKRFEFNSFVLPPSSNKNRKTPEEIDEEQLHREEIDRQGIEVVMKHEEAAGRFPNEMPHNHEGYDIESYNDNEIERYIEVKSSNGEWIGKSVRISPSQFLKAQELAENFYLYVVDNVFTNPIIYEIRDPANRATGFVYDSAWKDIEITDT